VLDLCDELNELKDRISRRRGDTSRAGAALLERKREKLTELQDQLAGAFDRGAAGELRKRFDLAADELLVTALLLSRRIRRGKRGLSGREILSTIYESAYDMVTGMRSLDAEGNLCSSGIVIAQEYGDDAFETRYRLSDEVFYGVLQDIAGGRGRGAGKGEQPYSRPQEHLVDMGRLSVLYRMRAAALFPVEAQDFFGADEGLAPEEIDYRIEAGWARIEERLLQTPKYEEYPLVRLERRYKFSREELVIVVSLFFVEMISPAPYLVVGDLVKLASRTEEDLLEKRLLFKPDAPLLRSGTVILDDEHSLHGKLSTYDAYLADDVVEALAPRRGGSGGITADTQIDIHEFLEGFSREEEKE